MHEIIVQKSGYSERKFLAGLILAALKVRIPIVAQDISSAIRPALIKNQPVNAIPKAKRRH